MHSRHADWFLLNFNIYCHWGTIDTGFSLVNIFLGKAPWTFLPLYLCLRSFLHPECLFLKFHRCTTLYPKPKLNSLQWRFPNPLDMIGLSESLYDHSWNMLTVVTVYYNLYLSVQLLLNFTSFVVSVLRASKRLYFIQFCRFGSFSMRNYT